MIGLRVSDVNDPRRMILRFAIETTDGQTTRPSFVFVRKHRPTDTIENRRLIFFVQMKQRKTLMLQLNSLDDVISCHLGSFNPTLNIIQLLQSACIRPCYSFPVTPPSPSLYISISINLIDH